MPMSLLLAEGADGARHLRPFRQALERQCRRHRLGCQALHPRGGAIALANMWVSVTKAGCTVTQELPIRLVVFIVLRSPRW